ncbi:MAG: hypothetical protein ABI992_11035, partial [Chthoniobacterales bacterium]
CCAVSPLSGRECDYAVSPPTAGETFIHLLRELAVRWRLPNSEMFSGRLFLLLDLPNFIRNFVFFFGELRIPALCAKC